VLKLRDYNKHHGSAPALVCRYSLLVISIWQE